MKGQSARLVFYHHLHSSLLFFSFFSSLLFLLSTLSFSPFFILFVCLSVCLSLLVSFFLSFFLSFFFSLSLLSLSTSLSFLTLTACLNHHRLDSDSVEMFSNLDLIITLCDTVKHGLKHISTAKNISSRPETEYLTAVFVLDYKLLLLATFISLIA